MTDDRGGMTEGRGQREEDRSECGLRPVGVTGAYVPEGRRKAEDGGQKADDRCECGIRYE